MNAAQGPVIVAGHVRFGPGEIDRLRADMDRVIAGTRAEPGCQVYTYARLLEDPDTIRIFEIWDSGADLTAHFKTPHMLAWYETLSTAEILDREVQVYPFTEVQAIRTYREG
ncbi:MAG: putative quinol monooxygenase [Pseudomonadota bacterium]